MFGVAGLALLVVALVGALLLLQSSDHLLWIGTRVTGTEQNGLVYYHWRGEIYSLAVNGNGNVKSVSVYFDPSDPENAMANSLVDRLPGIVFVGIPALIGLLLIVVGGTRNYRWERRRRKHPVDMWPL